MCEKTGFCAFKWSRINCIALHVHLTPGFLSEK